MEAPAIFERDWLRRHGFAVLTVALALALKLYLGEANGQHAPLLLLALSVTLGAWYGGLGPGLLATALAAVTALYFVIPPLYSFRIVDAAGWVQLTVFASEGVLISLLCEAQRRSRRAAAVLEIRERRATDDAKTLRREIERLQMELGRARGDLDHFVLAARRQAARELVEYADAMRLERSDAVNCNTVVESAIARTGAAVTHDPLPTIRGSEPQLRALFTRLLGECASGAHISAGYQGGGWTFRISYPETPGQCDAVARRIVEGHDGTLAVESAPGHGATLRIHIPRRPVR